MQTFISNSVEETQGIAKNLSHRNKNGAVIALFGDLGSGKTAFVQGFAKALDIQDKITSPTFVLIAQHPLPNSKSTLYHLDLYRLEEGFDHLGLEDLFQQKNDIILIEWAEKIVDKLPKDTIKITIEKINETSRKITVE